MSMNYDVAMADARAAHSMNPTMFPNSDRMRVMTPLLEAAKRKLFELRLQGECDLWSHADGSVLLRYKLVEWRGMWELDEQGLHRYASVYWRGALIPGDVGRRIRQLVAGDLHAGILIDSFLVLLYAMQIARLANGSVQDIEHARCFIAIPRSTPQEELCDISTRPSSK